MTADEPRGTHPEDEPPLAPPAVETEPAVPIPVAAVPPPAAAPVPAVVPPPAAAPVPAVAATVPAKAPTSLKVLSIVVMVAGVIMLVAGVAVWFVVRDQLANEHITVSADADHFGGNSVDSPWTAYAQAGAINKHALAAGGGKTYAQLPQDDPARDTVMTASFLRASLFTSVVSFGVAAFAAGMGLLMIIVGFVLLRLTKLFGTAPAPPAAA